MKNIADTPIGRVKTFDRSFWILLGITGCAAIGVALQHGVWRVVEIAARYLGFLLLLTPKILLGFFVAAALPMLIPPAQLRRWVGAGSGLRGLGIACLSGALVPGGPMMIFPLAASFLATGAARSTLISFVTAWSLYGVNRTVIWEMSFLPTHFVLLRVLICLPLPVLAGWAYQRLAE